MRMFDPFVPGLAANPYPTYASLRHESPVFELAPGGIFGVCRHKDILAVFKQPNLFSSAGFRPLLEPAWLGEVGNPIVRSILVMDPPTHSRLRTLINPAFSGEAMSAISASVQRIAEGIADELIERGEVNFAEDFGVAFPGRVMADLLGLDPALYLRCSTWADACLNVTPAPPTPERASDARSNIVEMLHHLREVVTERRRSPGTDVTSRLIAAEVDGDRLSDDEIVWCTATLLLGGFETVGVALTNALIFFMDHPSKFEELRSLDSEKVNAVANEILRLWGPTQGLFRVATEDTSIAGTSIPKGSPIYTLIPAGNRDEARFAEPDRWNPERSDMVNFLSYGYGAHYCIGVHLARMEMRIGLQTLARRFKRFERLPGKLSWHMNFIVRKLHSLPVRVLPA
jgi:cytochrome P450